MSLKIDIINGAYSQIKISGLTIEPSSEDRTVALNRLENILSTLKGQNSDVGYYFEDSPDFNTPHNMEQKFWDPVEVILAVSLCPDFGKVPPDTLIKRQSSAYSDIAAMTALVRPVLPPARMPRGSGATRHNPQWFRYNPPPDQAPLSAKTNVMNLDDIQDFVEHFDSFLRDGETVSSFTIAADTGLTINSSSLTTPDVSYQIKAVGDTSENPAGFYRLKIVATLSSARVITRIINFEIVNTNVIDT
jgi:hypothetical protein